MAVKKTGLYQKHVAMNGKMVEFAGYLMPIQYSGIIEEHKLVREKVGIFDVSHMGEVEVWGPKALEFVNKITINDASKLEINQAQYSAMCYPDGGIVDDLICYRRKDHYLLVVNASNTDKDFSWMQENVIDGADLINTSDQVTQLAVQGKFAEEILQKLTRAKLADIKFYWFQEGILADCHMIISRTGYTGEPGFELYFDKAKSEEVWEKIFETGEGYGLAPIGLGARDTLRLEKKYCLYGNDIDQSTNPLEAGLGWITKLDKDDFIGKSSLLKVKEQGITRKLVGFICEGRMIPRHNYEIQQNQQKIGFVTSGCYSPILDKNIGLGYINLEYSAIGNNISITARGRQVEAQIVKTPFV